MEDYQPGWWLRQYLTERYGSDAVGKLKAVGRQTGKTEHLTAILQPVANSVLTGPEFEFESLDVET